MADLLVDTDIFIDHLRGARRLQPAGAEIHYSVITRAELLAGPERQLDSVRTLLAPFTLQPVDSAVADLGGRIRAEAGVALPDALIAATALFAGLTLMTRNRRDFERIDGLRLSAPQR